MFEVRLHGRGGQGAVTAAELMSQAAISEGKYAQGFPSFGPERRGAPVTAFLRISPRPILLRERVDFPDAVVVLDQSLVSIVNVAEGLKPGGTLIINLPPERIGEMDKYRAEFRLALVDASTIAREELGVPITNTAILGALIKATGLVDLASLEEPLDHRFGRLAKKNLAALKRAHAECQVFELKAAPKPHPADQAFHIEAIEPWTKLELGGDIVVPGSSREFLTGNWRTACQPETDREKCVKCGLCWAYCPEVAFSVDAEGYYAWDARYCKGCGICAEECPAGAIAMRE